ncbi:hypothetical protein QVD17_18929 [Tagetes erecta]|uniref:Uncharacterized protein n=1 Tax=Tagetes erecta TaxID=13708 RepID=A0AAD8KLE4_TARER|nr:hypothetical protein QVD17_18929 [Tagetes erecta]
MANNSNVKLHIAMLPWFAFGHLIPFLELAKLIASKGHKITFISTPKNINHLPKIPQPLTPFITFIKLNLPKLQNLPENAESTRDLPSNKVKYLKIAYDHLKEPVVDILNTLSPNWIIYDFTTYWLGPLAAEHGIKTAYFSVFPAMALGYVGSPETLMHGDDEQRSLDDQDFVKKPKWVSFESQVKPSGFQLTKATEYAIADDENVSDFYRLGAAIQGSDVVIVRSCFGFEPEWLNLLKQLYKKPVIPAGLLPAVDNPDGNADWLETKKWLDMHEKGSVVYIAFGTETKPSQYELTQLALGLETSLLPFYWVLIDQRGSLDEVVELPSGFEERTRGRGVVCRGWAPQFKIVSHDSVGVLLIHSGMSSVVEGFQLGKPLVLLPLLFDQGLIASYLVEKKMAYIVRRDDVDGSFTPESVADSLSLVMASEEGKMYRDKAKEMMCLFGDRNVQDKCLNELLHFLQMSCKK